MKKYSLLLSLLMIILLFAGCQGKNASGPVHNNAVKSKPVQQSGQKVQALPQNADANGQPATQTIAWYLVPNKTHLTPGINQSSVDMLTQNQVIYCLPNPDKKIYLTFDCGYELGYTPAILDTLQQKQIKAAFFITGQYIKTQPELVKRMHNEGHLVCNHTYNHPDLAKADQNKLTQEVTSLEKAYQDLTGVAMDKYLRPPMGSYSEASLKWTKALGYTTVFWSMAWKDWDPQQQPGADFVYTHVMENIHPGAVILMHAVSASDTEALARVIDDLQAQGYTFSTF